MQSSFVNLLANILVCVWLVEVLNWLNEAHVFLAMPTTFMFYITPSINETVHPYSSYPALCFYNSPTFSNACFKRSTHFILAWPFIIWFIFANCLAHEIKVWRSKFMEWDLHYVNSLIYVIMCRFLPFVPLTLIEGLWWLVFCDDYNWEAGSFPYVSRKSILLWSHVWLDLWLEIAFHMFDFELVSCNW